MQSRDVQTAEVICQIGFIDVGVRDDAFDKRQQEVTVVTKRGVTVHSKDKRTRMVLKEVKRSQMSNFLSVWGS